MQAVPGNGLMVSGLNPNYRHNLNFEHIFCSYTNMLTGHGFGGGWRSKVAEYDMHDLAPLLLCFHLTFMQETARFDDEWQSKVAKYETALAGQMTVLMLPLNCESTALLPFPPSLIQNTVWLEMILNPEV